MEPENKNPQPLEGTIELHADPKPAAPPPAQPAAPTVITPSAAPTPPPPAPAPPPQPSVPPLSPAPPQTGQVISGGFESPRAAGPQAPQQPTPFDTPSSSPPPNIVVGGPPEDPNNPTTPQSSTASGGKRKVPKWAIAVIAAVLLIGGAAAAFYFGYYTNPSVIYSQSLRNTGKGYDKLTSYIDAQSKVDYKGTVGTGSYNLDAGDFSTDGQVSFKSDDKNSELKFDLGLGTDRLTVEARSFDSPNSESPDLYVKGGSLTTVGDLIGAPELQGQLKKIDNTWIFIDHTFIDNFQKMVSEEDTAETPMPTKEQVLDEMKAFGKVNQDYLFTSRQDKAVLKVVAKKGNETVDGHKTYRYTVALNKDNVKAYVNAQASALKNSQLNDWVKKNKLESDVDSFFKDAAESTKDIKDSDTFDMWVDTDRRIVYKLRFADEKKPAESYVDVGLDYKGGDQYPFFIAGKDTSDFKLVATLNSKTNSIDFKFNADFGNDNGSVTGNMNFKPSNETVDIDKPTGAKPLADVLRELGLQKELDALNNPSQINTLVQ